MKYAHFSFVTAALAGALALSGCGDNTSQNSDSNGDDSTTNPSTEAGDDGGDEYPLECLPGEMRCGDAVTVETCAPTGLEWEQTPCDEFQMCELCNPEEEECGDVGARCVGPCESDAELPSSAGCKFTASRNIHSWNSADEFADGLVITNPNEEQIATVSIFDIEEGSNDPELVEMVMLSPGETHIYEFETSFVAGLGSQYRTGGIQRVISDLPVTVFQHGPLTAAGTNDSSMLLPDRALGQDYVALSYPPMFYFQDQDEDAGCYLGGNDTEGCEGRPSYFTVVALEDFTTVSWTPKNRTAGNGLPLSPVDPGETGTQVMNRFDTMRVAASRDTEDPELRDVSGATITSDKPIWVMGGTNCSFVPFDPVAGLGLPPQTIGVGDCDHLQEQLIPLLAWGEQYVAPAAPRYLGDDLPPAPHVWRIFAGADDVSISSTPAVFAPTVLDNRGEFIEFQLDPGTSFVLNADGPVMPVQYLTIIDAGPDAAMYQMVPTDQFLGRYVFATGLDFTENYVQIIREEGSAPVFVDDIEVTGYVPVADGWEFADWPVPEGSHIAVSEDDFGILQVGFREAGISPNGEACEATSDCPDGFACAFGRCTEDRGPCLYDDDCPGSEEFCCEEALARCCGTHNNPQCIPEGEDTDVCVRRPGASSYAYPGGLKVEPIYFP